jgi:hypothetical protein
MRSLLAALTLALAVPVAAQVSPVPPVASKFTATAPTGTPAFQIRTPGARLVLGHPGIYLYDDGVQVRVPGAMRVDGTLAATGANGVQTALVAPSNGTQLVVKGWVVDGATAIATKLGAGNALTTAGAKVISFYRDDLATEVLAIDKDGAPVLPQRCDSTGSPGNATCNQAAGRAALGAGNSSIVITNSLIAASSIVNAILQTSDTTCLRIERAVPSAGSVSIQVNSACTATTNLGWWIAAK